MTEANIKTGNPIVDALSKINISGNVIPESWYSTIVNENGKSNLMAIMVLSDIVYWYKPTEVRSEDGSKVTYKRKFADKNYLQRNYEQIAEKFNISKRQARNTIVFLEELGVVKRHLKHVDSAKGLIPNVMFLELIPDVLCKLTYPANSDNDVSEIGGISLSNQIDTHTKSEGYLSENGETNTKTTTQITTNTSTTTIEGEKSPLAVVDIKKVFYGLGLCEKDILAIAKASDYGIEKCRTARKILDQQTRPITNVAGWLIKAIKENYQPISKPVTKKKAFGNYEQRAYTKDFYDELERVLLNSPPPNDGYTFQPGKSL